MNSSNATVRRRASRLLLAGGVSVLAMSAATGAFAQCTNSGVQPLNNLAAGNTVNCTNPPANTAIAAPTPGGAVTVNMTGVAGTNTSIVIGSSGNLTTAAGSVVNLGAATSTDVTAGLTAPAPFNLEVYGNNATVTAFTNTSNPPNQPGITLTNGTRFVVSGDGATLNVGAPTGLTNTLGAMNIRRTTGTAPIIEFDGTNYTQRGYLLDQTPGLAVTLQGSNRDQLFDINGIITNLSPTGKAIDAGGGNDAIRIGLFAQVPGTIDGGSGDDSLTLYGGNISSNALGTISNIETINIDNNTTARLAKGITSAAQINLGANAYAVFDSAELIHGGSNFSIAGNGRLILTTQQTGNVAVDQGIVGPGALELGGFWSGVDKTFVFNRSNTFSGGTTVQDGVVILNDGGALGTGAVNLAGFQATLRVGDITLNNNVSGVSGIIDKTSAGVTVLNGTNTHGGGTFIRQGSLEVTSGASLGTGAVTIDAPGTLRVDNAADSTLNSALQGAGAFIKDGAGRLILAGANAGLTGTVTIDQGVLQTSGSNTLGTGDVNITATGVLDLNTTGSTVLSNDLTGAGAVVKTGTGTVELTGANTYAGGTDIQEGALRVTDTSKLGTGSLLVQAGAALDLSIAGTDTFNQAISGAGQLRKSGAGDLTVVSNTLTGGVDITQGRVIISSAGAIGSGNVSTSLGAALVFDTSSPTAEIISTQISGAGGLTKAGTGDLIVQNANTYSGATRIEGGRLTLNNGAGMGTGAVVNDAALRIGNVTVANNISGSGSVEKTSSGLGVLSGANTYTGGTSVSDGTLQVASAAALGAGGVAIASGATLEVNNASTSSMSNTLSGAGGLTKTGAGDLVVQNTNTYNGATRILAGRLILNNGGGLGTGAVINNAALRIGNVAVANTISGTGSVEKTSSGFGVLSGANTYSGGTAVNAGTLQVASTGALGTGAVAVASGATLEVANTGADTLVNAVSGAGGLAKSGAGDLTIQTANTYTGGTQIAAGRVILTDGAGLGTGAVVNNAALRIGDVTVANAISGTGAVEKTGSGAGSLTGANTYSGGTAVGAGTLQVASGAALGSGGVAIASGATLQVTNASAATLGNTLSGAGGLNKTGAGDLTLTGANTHSGGVAIAGGRVIINAAAGAGAGPVTTASGTSLVVDNSTAQTLTAAISGAGGVIKQGAGDLTIQNTNTYNGGTQIMAGRLTLANGGGLGSGAVVNNAALRIGDVTVTNAISGTGSVEKTGSGVGVLSGANTYAGGTTVSAGTLQIASSGALGTGGVAIASGATLEMANTGSATLGAALTGAGGLRKTGAGELALTGANTHTGGTAVNAGTVRVTTPSALGSGAVSVASGATLEVANTTAATYANATSGAGTLRKTGAGQLAFTSPFTIGALAIDAGRARINTTATTNTLVGANGALDGTGRIVGNLTSNGLVAPGNSIGTLTVQGNYIHNSGAVLEVEFDGAGNIDLLDVTGTATLNGGILRFVSVANAEGSGGTFLTAAGGVTGTFATVETVGAQLPLAVIYQPNSAIMAPSVLTARPSTFNAQTLAAADTGFAFAGRISGAASRQGGERRVWADAFTASDEHDAAGATLAYEHDTQGAATGISVPVGENLSVGAAIGYSSGDITLGSGGGGGEQDATLGAVYARYGSGRISVNGGVMFGQIDQRTLRNVSFNTFSDSVSGVTSSTLVGGFAQGEATLWTSGGWTLGAQGRAAMMRQSQDGYTENGVSPLRLTIAGLTARTTEGQALLNLQHHADLGGGRAFNVRLQGGYRYLGVSDDRAFQATFAASNATVTMFGDTRNISQFQTGLDLTYDLSQTARVSFGYTGLYGKADEQQARVGVDVAF